MFPITKQQLDESLKRLNITDITQATIRQICSLAAELEAVAGEKFVHLEIGNPGIEAMKVGIEAECNSLQNGIANKYPNIAGIPELKEAGSKFIKAFLDVDMLAECIIPTVGSMQGSYALMMLLGRRDAKRDTMLFVNPGFPAQRYQAKLLGLKEASFDIYAYRGKKLEAKLEEMFAAGNITAMIYCNPNNPAWINLTEEELEIIGRLATKYGVIVMEDLAYLGMDFRRNTEVPGEPPFVPTVAKYTDNYIMMVSASKIFSYAGQRIAMAAFSPVVANMVSEDLKKIFGIPSYLNAFVFGVLYALSSGTSHSAQYAMAAMLKASAEGELNFVDACREYEKRGKRVKQIFTDNGFDIVYARDGEEPISDGFFFTAGYGNMTSEELQRELMRYGVASISLPSTGSLQNGLRVCVSMINDEEGYNALNNRLAVFHNDSKA